MITDSLLMYLLFQLILLVVSVIGYKRIPFLLFMTIMGSIVIAVPTVTAFGEYYPMAIVLILINLMFPVIGLTRAVKS